MGVAHVSGNVERQCGCVCHVHVKVGTVVKTVIGVAVVVFLVELLEQTALGEHTCRDEVAHLLASSADVHVVLCLQRGVFHDVVGPLRAREPDGVGAGAEHLEHLVGELRSTSVVLSHHVVEQGIFVARCLLNHLCRHQEAERGRTADARLSLLASLGSDEHHAVGASHTEHSRCRCVLEHGDALDFVGVDVAHRALHTVNLYERGGVFPCSLSAHEHRGGVRARLT